MVDLTEEGSSKRACESPMFTPSQGAGPSGFAAGRGSTRPATTKDNKKEKGRKDKERYLSPQWRTACDRLFTSDEVSSKMFLVGVQRVS